MPTDHDTVTDAFFSGLRENLGLPLAKELRAQATREREWRLKLQEIEIRHRIFDIFLREAITDA